MRFFLYIILIYHQVNSFLKYVFHQALSSLPGGLYELLRSVHIQNLKNDEVLLLKDSRTLAVLKDAGSLVSDYLINHVLARQLVSVLN